MVNIYAGWSDAAKKAKLNELSGVYERLVTGGAEFKIVDEDTGEVVYTPANLPGLEKLITQLQADLGTVPHRGAIPVTFGGM